MSYVSLSAYQDYMGIVLAWTSGLVVKELLKRLILTVNSNEGDTHEIIRIRKEKIE